LHIRIGKHAGQLLTYARIIVVRHIVKVERAVSENLLVRDGEVRFLDGLDFNVE